MNILISLVASITLIVGYNNVSENLATGNKGNRSTTKSAKQTKSTNKKTDVFNNENEKYAAIVVNEKGDTITYMPHFVPKKIVKSN